jgi:hypothetical protein
VVWEGQTPGSSRYEIFLYDGASTTQLTNNIYDDTPPALNDGGSIVWSGCDGVSCNAVDGDNEIFLFDGASTTQLTDNGYHDLCPEINENGYVTWEGWGESSEVWLFDGVSTTQISSNSYHNKCPRINDNGYVVWYGSLPHSDNEIFLAIPCSFENDYDEDLHLSAFCGGDDCNENSANVNPGVVESDSQGNCSDNLDNDCDGNVDGADPDCTAGSCTGSVAASTLETSPVYGAPDLGNHLVYSLIAGSVIIGMSIWRWRRKKLGSNPNLKEIWQ